MKQSHALRHSAREGPWSLDLVLASLLLPLVAGAAPPTPGCINSTFQVFWNIVDNANGSAKAGTGPQLDNSTLASEYLFTRGDQTLTRGNAGNFWPSCSTDAAGNPRPVNGGIPQLGNLTGHLQELTAFISGSGNGSTWGMDANFSGNAVFDFEMWRPVFVGQWNDPCYENLSIALVRSEHPDWTNETQIFAQAELEFETAGMAWFVESLNVGKALVPHAAWGFYGYPANLFQPCVNAGADPQCGYHHPVAGPAQRAINDVKYAPLWAASTGLFTSIYLNSWTAHPSWASRNQDYVAGTVEEMRRVASSRTKVRPFAWNYYMDGEGAADGDLQPWDLQMLLTWPKYAGADDMVFWGAPFYGGHNFNSSVASLADFYGYLNSTLGPAVQASVLDNCACSAANCSSHGVCIGGGACRCMDGFSGDICNITSQSLL